MAAAVEGKKERTIVSARREGRDEGDWERCMNLLLSEQGEESPCGAFVELDRPPEEYEKTCRKSR
jgi:hypothetical protein